jgi:hypothetical protein
MPARTSGLVRQAVTLVRDMTADEVEKLFERITYELKIPTVLRHPDLPGIVVTAEFWTVTEADTAMEVNDENRTRRERVVLAYYRNIVNEKWPFTGESVAFDVDGKFFDGQHRCKAIRRSFELALEAGMDEGEARATVGIWTLVVRGLPKEIRDFKDIGIGRTDKDRFELMGIPYAAKAAPIAKWIAAWQATDTGATPGTSTYQPTPAEVQKVAAQYRDSITECSAYAEDIGKRAPELHIKPRVAGMARWLFTQFDQSTGHQFMEWVATGAGVDEDNPALAVRKLFMAQDTTAARRLLGGKERLNAIDQLGLLILAFNVLQGQGDSGDIYLPKGGYKARNMPQLAYRMKVPAAPASNGTSGKAPPAAAFQPPVGV